MEHQGKGQNRNSRTGQ